MSGKADEQNAAPDNGRKLYNLYLSSPPTRQGAAHREAYFSGLNGLPKKYIRGSVAWWAQKAGKHNAKKKHGGTR